MAAADPVLERVVSSAVEATSAERGWLLRREGGELEVVAVAGEGTSGLLGRRVPADEGSAGYVMVSGRPLTLAASTYDERLTGGVAGLAERRPRSLLSVPCGSGTVVGALELADK